MAQAGVELQPDYVKQFKENFIGGLLGEDNIDDETLELVTSSVEKIYSPPQPSTSKFTSRSKIRVKRNLFNISKQHENDLSSFDKLSESKNLSGRESDMEDVKLSQAITNKPGKFFGSGGNAQVLNGATTPKRKKSPQKLSKFSPFNKKARVNNSCSIKNYFPVIKPNNSIFVKANQEDSRSRPISNNTSTYVNTIKENVTSTSLDLDDKVNSSSDVADSNCVNPVEETVDSSTNNHDAGPILNTPDSSSPKHLKQPFVDSYNNLVLRCLLEINVHEVPKLLSSEEDSHLAAFGSVAPSAQRIYCRLLSRKFDWIRVSTMKYGRVTRDLIGDIDSLENCGLVTIDLSEESISSLCNYLTVPELKTVCQTLNISSVKSVNKSDVINVLLTHSKQKQISSFFKRENTTNTLVLEQLILKLGKCVKLTEEPRKTVLRCLLFYSYPHYRGLEKDRFQDQLSVLKAWTDDKVTFPEYKVLRTELFPSREHFLEYEAALEIKSELLEAIEAKHWSNAIDIVTSLVRKYENYAKNTEKMAFAKQLPECLRRYTAGGVYVSAINKGIAVLRKFKDYINDAENCLCLLLNQSVFSEHLHGKLVELLALTYQQNMKKNVNAASVVFRGLKNKNKLDTVSRHVLTARAALLIKRKTNQIPDVLKNKLQSVMETTLNEPYEIKICEQVLPGVKPGRKQIYVQESSDGKTLSSVEEVARAHFRNEGYSQGRHDEGGTIRALVLVCFWDIIYSTEYTADGHSLFHSNFQTAPLDWNYESFYVRRKELIDKRLEELQNRSINLWQTIEECHQKYYNIESVVQWTYLENLSVIKGLVECLDINSFVAIARLLITNYSTYHAGFPDLTLWNPHQKKCLFVEVKSPNDTLSIKQKLWLHNLKQFSVKALVCHVDSVGCKMKNKPATSLKC